VYCCLMTAAVLLRKHSVRQSNDNMQKLQRICSDRHKSAAFRRCRRPANTAAPPSLR